MKGWTLALALVLMSVTAEAELTAPIGLFAATHVPFGNSCRNDRDCDFGLQRCLEPGGFRGCGICFPDFMLEGYRRCTNDSECLARGAGEICEPLGDASRTCTPCSGPRSVCLAGCSDAAPCEEGQVCEEHRCVGQPCLQSHECPAAHDCDLPSAGQGRCIRRPCVTDVECADGVCVKGACYTELGRCEAIPG